MIPTDFFVEVADFAHDRSAIAQIREPVFVVEQAVPPEIVWDTLDARCRHVLARDLAGNPIGSGRLTPEGAIGRLAVLRSWRGRGVGQALLTTLIDCARSLHLPQVELHSQVHAIPFYLRAGFVAEGEVYMEAGIPHQTMRLRLDAQPPLERSEPPKGAESAELEINTLDEARGQLLSLLRAAKRQLWIYSRDLDPALFQGEEIGQELRRIATAGRGAEIRILVQDVEAAQRHGGALQALAQRLSSCVFVHQPGDDVDLQFAGAYVLNDAAGLLSRPIGSRYDGIVQTHAPGRHRQLLDQFRQAWDRSRPASELRAQGL